MAKPGDSSTIRDDFILLAMWLEETGKTVQKWNRNDMQSVRDLIVTCYYTPQKSEDEKEIVEEGRKWWNAKAVVWNGCNTDEQQLSFIPKLFEKIVPNIPIPPPELKLQVLSDEQLCNLLKIKHPGL